MLGILLAIATSFFQSLSHLASKICMKKVNEYTSSWCVRFFSIPVLLGFLLYSGIPELGPHFWLVLVINALINTLNTVLYMKALKYGDLSETVPLTALTPLFLLIASPLIVHEFPSSQGLIGVLFIVSGAYVLNVNQGHVGLLGPFKSIYTNKGSRYMLLLAALWSVTSTLDKLGVQNSSPAMWSFSVTAFIMVVLTPLMFAKAKEPVKEISTHFKILILIGVLQSLVLLFQFSALQHTLVTYVISIKRASAIFAVLWGWLFLKEKNIKERLLGSVIMVAGVILITLS